MKYSYSTSPSAPRNRTRTGFPLANNPALSLVGAGGTVTSDATAGTATAEVTTPARIAAADEGHGNGPGWFSRSLAALQGGPAPLVAPALSGTGEPGTTLGLLPAAWIAAETAGAVSVRYRLEVDRGDGAGWVALPGHEDAGYGDLPPHVVAEADRGAGFRLTETATGPATGAATAQSAVLTVPLADAPVTSPTLATPAINQDADIGTGGTETALGAFAAAGRYIVAVTDLNAGGQPDFALEGAAVTGATALGRTAGADNTHVQIFLVDASGPGELTVRNQGGPLSYARQILILHGEGLTDDGAVFAAATGAAGADPLSLSFVDIPGNRAVVAIGACRDGSSSDAAWGGLLSGADELSDAPFTNTTHRTSAAATTMAPGAATLSLAFDDNGNALTRFAMAAVLLPAAAAAPAGAGAHPGHLIEAATVSDLSATTLTHHRGWGPGDHYTFEVNQTNPHRMTLEPGETTDVWYFDDEIATGLSIADLEGAAYANQTFADPFAAAAWLASAANRTGPQAGLRSDKRVTPGLFYYLQLEIKADGLSPWYDFADGATIPSDPFTVIGESPLHPQAYGCLTNPNGKAILAPAAALENASNAHVAFIGIDSPHGLSSFGFADDNYLFCDCNVSADEASSGLNMYNADRWTYYACNITDCTPLAPAGGDTRWDGDDRLSGTHSGNGKRKLDWRCFYDHNGWDDTYDRSDPGNYAAGTYGKHPEILSHNAYDAADGADFTFLEHINARPANTAIQGRSGYYMNLGLFLDCNASGQLSLGEFFVGVTDPGTEFTEGETVTFTNGKQLTFLRHSRAGSAAEQRKVMVFEAFNPQEAGTGLPDVGDTVTGQTSGLTCTVESVDGEAGNYSLVDHAVHVSIGWENSTIPRVRNGLYRDNVLRNMIVANSADPQDATDQSDKAGHTGTDTGLGSANTYLEDIQLYNWGGAANQGLDGLTLSALDAATIGGFVDDLRGQALGTETTDSAIDYMHDNYSHPALALSASIWNHFASLFGKTQVGHTAGATATFTPNPDLDGFRMDGIGNWRLNGGPDSLVNKEDYPIDGDSLDLDGNLAFSFMTFRFADLDFGAGGGIRIYGGLISCTSSQAVSAGSVELHNAGKFRVSGTQTTAYTVTADGGRYEVDGTVSGISGSFSGQSQCIVYGGGALTISAGETLTLSGDAGKIGFDGQNGDVATLTLAGTLAFVAGPASFSRIREVRTGRFGMEGMGAGVTGQPRASDVVSTVVLGGALSVDVTGLPPDTYTLIKADVLSGSFDSVTVTGGAGTVTVDPGIGWVSVTVS